MISETGTISENGSVTGQVQIMENENGKRVQLYNADGVFLSDCPFEGDNDVGYLIGYGMYRAYQSAWKNAKVHYHNKISESMAAKGYLEI